ncbi:MAG: hypothetical protein JKY45_01290 [Emcibacter sp.]|nr:hypothetical protein [Emcibacter sp.]
MASSRLRIDLIFTSMSVYAWGKYMDRSLFHADCVLITGLASEVVDDDELEDASRFIFPHG